MDANPTNRTGRLHARLKPREREVVERAAEATDQKLSEFIREAVVGAARRVLLERERVAA